MSSSIAVTHTTHIAATHTHNIGYSPTHTRGKVLPRVPLGLAVQWGTGDRYTRKVAFELGAGSFEVGHNLIGTAIGGVGHGGAHLVRSSPTPAVARVGTCHEAGRHCGGLHTLGRGPLRDPAGGRVSNRDPALGVANQALAPRSFQAGPTPASVHQPWEFAFPGLLEGCRVRRPAADFGAPPPQRVGQNTHTHTHTHLAPDEPGKGARQGRWASRTDAALKCYLCGTDKAGTTGAGGAAPTGPGGNPKVVKAK